MKHRETKDSQRMERASVQFSGLVVSDSLRPHEPQHARPPCPSPNPGVYPNSWLSGSWRSFLYTSVYSCHLFLISSASVRFIPFLSFIEPIFASNVPLVSLIFLKRSLDFPILMFSSISLHWSVRKAFLSLLAILWNSAFKWVYLSFSPLCFVFLLSTYLNGLVVFPTFFNLSLNLT